MLQCTTAPNPPWDFQLRIFFFFRGEFNCDVAAQLATQLPVQPAVQLASVCYPELAEDFYFFRMKSNNYSAEDQLGLRDQSGNWGGHVETSSDSQDRQADTVTGGRKWGFRS